MECHDVRRLIDASLDGALEAEAAREVSRHLDTCPECRREFEQVREQRHRLRSAFDASEALRPRPDLSATLAQRLHPVAGQPSRRSVLRSWWALAASAVLAIGGGYVIRREREQSRLAALARLAAGDHQNCAVAFKLHERPIPMAAAAQRFGLPYRALTDFVPPTPEPARVLDRHACVYEGHRFAHVVFLHEGEPASLLVIDAPPPSAPRLERDIDGTVIVSLPAGRFAAFLVMSTRDRDAALRLGTACVDPLAARLA